MSAGWLTVDQSSSATLAGGRRIDRQKFPTRFEEYTFVLNTLAKLQPGAVLDAGAGFNPEIHVLPYCLDELGWHVIAVDANPESLNMPPAQRVSRILDDLAVLWRWQGIDLDAYVCVSTLEHLGLQQQMMALTAARGVLRSGGIAILTADFIAPDMLNGLLRFAGFETGGVTATMGPLLTPRVAFAVGQKP